MCEKKQKRDREKKISTAEKDEQIEKLSVY